MVEENFKIGIELEVDSGSLSGITKQVEKAVKLAFDRATAGLALGGGSGAAPPAVAGGAATAKSVREATRVTARDFTDAVEALARENRVVASRFDDAAATVVSAMNKLASQMEKQARGVSAGPAKSDVVDKQVGPSNKNLAREIQKSRQEAGRQTASGGTSERRDNQKQGTPRDRGEHPLAKAAQMQARSASDSLAKFNKLLLGMGALGKIPDILKRLAIPEAQDVRVGPGASVEVKTLSGQAKVVTTALTIAGGKVTEFTDVLTKRIRELISSPEFGATMNKAERTARRDPERAIAMTRRELKGLFDLPVSKLGGAQSFEKGGEGLLTIDFSDNKSLQDRLSALKDESSQIALLNAELWNMSDALKELRKRGAEVVGSVGLGEAGASSAKIIKGEGGRPIGAELPVQLRDLAGMILGGRGAMRPMRSFQPQQAREMVGGHRPEIMGKGEAMAYETGMFKEQMTRTLKTAYLDPRKTPEVHEDMILIDKKAADKMAMWEPKITDPMKALAEDFKAGQKLIHGQLMGYDVEGKEVKFDMKGIDSEVEGIEAVVENGLKGFRIKLKELYPLMTGGKIGTISGFKGVVKVEEDLAKKYSLPEGTEAAISGHGAAKRGILSDPMKMMASQIAEMASSEASKYWRQDNAGDPAYAATAATPSAQEVADRIEQGMQEGGQDLVAAVEAAAKFFSVGGFGGGGAAMVGNMPWLRHKEPREPGTSEVGNRYLDLPAMRSLSMRADTAKMAEDMMARMAKVTEKQKEFVNTLMSLAGASDVASEKLSHMLPEEFRKLPPGVGAMEDFADTILDPRFKEAMAIRLPTKGGGERLMRMPEIGKGLGARGAFETPLGAKGSDPITRQFDQIMQTARQIRQSEGRVAPDVTGLDVESETFKDAAQKTREAIRQQVAASYSSAEAADAFVASFLPLIKGLQLAEDVSFFKLNQQGERVNDRPVPTARAGSSAEEFVQAGSSAQVKMLRMQDVLRGRAATKNVARGQENVPTAGALMQNPEILQKVMGKLGITLAADAAAADKLYVRLEKLEGELLSMYSTLAFATESGGKPGSVMKTPYASQMGAGISLSPKELTAVQFRTDIDAELTQVSQALLQLEDSAPGVSDALMALSRMMDAQGGAGVQKIPRDAVLLNKSDWNNLVQATMKERGIGQEEAESRVSRTGLLHRYPTTGAASFLATRPMTDPRGEMPEGRIGVAGPMAVSSAEDLAKMMAPLRDRMRQLGEAVDSSKGLGDAAESAKMELANLVPVVQKMNQLYLAAGLNLDFDGDKISFLADTATKAGSGLETFTQKIERGAVSFQQMMAESLHEVAGGDTGTLKQFSDMFGQVAKGRTGDLKRSVLMPQTGETARFEAQSLIGPKKSVGLLTDVFNKIMVSVTHGTKSVGDSFATGMDYIMLNINKSLAQKGGGGGVAGPLDFVENLKGGRTGEIFKSMDTGGSDIYGEMGKYNQKMREKMQEQFANVFRLKGGAGLMDEARMGGIEDMMPKDITYENFQGAIKTMVDNLDLKAVISRMFENMKTNMLAALQSQGLDMSEAKKAMEDMLTPSKGGKVKGLDLDRLLGQLAPEYLGTREKQIKGFRQASPMEQAQEALRVLMRDVSAEAEAAADEFELGDVTAPLRNKLREVMDKATAMFTKASGRITPVTNQRDFKSIISRGSKMSDEQVASIGGHVKYTRSGKDRAQQGGSEVFVSKQLKIQPFLNALQELQKISEGGPITAENLQKVSEGLKGFGVTVSHEAVHQANKLFTEAKAGLVRSLGTGIKGQPIEERTAVGTNLNKLIGGMSARAFNVKAAFTAERKVRTETPEDTGALRAAGNRAMKILAEELLAYQADPAAFKELMQAAGVTDDAIAELSDHLHKLVRDVHEAGGAVLEQDILQYARASLEASSEVRSLIEVVNNLGSAAAGTEGVLTGVSDILSHLGRGGDVTGFLQGANERLTSQEAAVFQGTNMLGLPTIARGKHGQLSTPEDIRKTGLEGQFPLQSTNAMGLLKRARVGFGDSGEMLQAQKEMFQVAGDLRAGAGQLAKNPQSGVGAGKGQAIYLQLLRDFDQAVSISYINKARLFQAAIGEMKATGEDVKDPGKFRDLLNLLDKAVTEHLEFLQSTLMPRGKARTMVSNIATAGGELAPAAMQAGITIPKEALQASYSYIMGQGEEGKAFTNQMGPALDLVITAASEGADITKAWSFIWDALIEKPELMHTNIIKVAEILSRTAVAAGTTNGKFSETVDWLMQIVKLSRDVGRATAGKDMTTPGARETVFAGASKQGRLAAAAGTGGGTLGESIAAQYEEAEAAMKSYQARLQTLVNDQAAFAKVGRPKHFAPMTKDIVDPQTGQVLQRIQITAERAGNTVVTQMKNATNATNMWSNQLRGALRRVVQWGFASGAIYGLVRAFNSLVGVVVTVQNKMVELQKVMDPSITNFDKMQDTAVDMAKNFGIAIEDVLDGMVVYGQQGLKMADITERTKATLMAVNTTTLDSTEATEALTAAHKVFGDEIGTSMEFVDAWAAVAAKHAISAEDLADAVKRSGSAAGVAGVSFQDFLGIVTAIGSVTRQSGKEVATATKFMFRTMRSGGAQKQLGRMGIQSLEATGDYRPAMDVLKQLSGTWGDLTRAQQINVAQSIAGIRHYNQFIVLMENFDEAMLASANAQNSQGFAAKKNALVMESVSKNIGVLKETLKGLGLALGKSVLGPATMLVKIVTVLADKISLLPDGLLAGVTALGAMGMVGGRAANVLDDLITMFAGADFTKTAKQLGGIGIMKAGAKGIGQFGKGVAQGGIRATLGVAADTKAMGAGMAVGRGLVTVGSMATNTLAGLTGMIGKVLPSFALLTTAIEAVSLATMTLVGATVIGAIIAGLGYIIYKWQEGNKTGADFAKTMEKAIGQSQDYASQLRTQSVSLGGVSTALAKLGKLSAKNKDLTGMERSMKGGIYKSVTVAAEKLADTASQVAEAMGMLDPTKISGISETGELIVDLNKNMQQVTLSALDAQNAITMAFQSRVVEAFTKDLVNAKGSMNKVKQWFTELFGGGKTKKGEEKFSLLGQLEELQDKLRSATEERNKLNSAGYEAVGSEEKVRDLLEQRRETTAEILEITAQIKQTMDDMPRFEDLGMAAQAMGPEFFRGAEAAEQVGGGAFGRGATEQSITFGALAKQVGLQGLVDYRTAKSPAMLAGSLAERGVRATAGIPEAGQAGTGDVTIVGRDIARQIALGATTGLQGAELDKAISAAQMLVTQVDEATGESIYYFADTFGNRLGAVTSQGLADALKKVQEGAKGDYELLGQGMVTFQRKAFEAAQEQTQKLLSLTYVGAMAGVRVPEGGMPDIGLATRADMSAEQRVMGVEAMVAPLQRLSDIQSEMTQLGKEYSETVLDDVEGSYARQAQNASALKVFTSDVATLVMQLQEEAFNISVIGHYQKAIEELGVTMDAATRTARDASIEEQTRAEFLTQTAGAMRGFSEVPTLDLGKSMKEITSMERLVRTVPGFGGGLQKIASTERERETKIQNLTDIRKQKANFEDIVRSMEAAGDKLSEEQKKHQIELASTGDTSKDAVAFISALQEDDKITQGILNKQVNIQERQASLLEIIAKATSAPLGRAGDAPREEARKALGAMESQDLVRAALGRISDVFGAEKQSTVINKTLGLQEVATGDVDKPTKWERTNTTNLAFQSADQANQFESVLSRILEMKTAMPELSKLDQRVASTYGEGSYEGRTFRAGNEEDFTAMPGKATESANAEINRLQDLLFEIPGVAKSLFDVAKGELTSPKAVDDAQRKKGDTHEDEMLRLRAQAEQTRMAAMSRFTDEEAKAAAEILKATSDLAQKKSPLRLAQAAMDFATNLDNMVLDFKKAEALQYEKIDSDLEGPFARVGQPGFKNTFEQKREEINARRTGGPRSLEQMRQEAADLASLEYDEKEAKIKEQQDIETSALRTQQGQAEQFRQIMADALFSGDLEGTGMEGDVRNMMDTLTGQLATSEQAQMGPGGELTFAGIPALEEAVRMSQKAKEVAQQKATEVLGKGLEQYITTPLNNTLQEIFGATLAEGQILGQIARNTSTLGGGMASAAGSTAGMAAVTPQQAASSSAPVVRGVPPAALQAGNIGPVLPQQASMGGLGAGALTAMGLNIKGASKAPMVEEIKTALGMVTNYDLGKRVEGAANIYKGEARTYTGGDEDQFVQDQTIKTRRPGGPLTEVENMRTMASLEQRSPATRVFSPKSFDEMPFQQGMNPQQMLERIQSTRALFEAREGVPGALPPAQGRTNTNIASDIQANRLGNAKASSSGTVQVPNKPTTGSKDFIQQKSAEAQTPADRGATGGESTQSLSDAISALNEQFSALVSALSSITEIGSKIDGTTAAVEALGEGLDVNITSGTIEVSNLGEVADAINTGVSAVGADVTDARTRLALLETVVDPNGLPVDERFSEFQTTLDTAVTQVGTDLEAAKEEIRVEVTELAENAATAKTEELQVKLTELEGLQTDLEAAKEEQARLLADINAAIAKTQEELTAAAEAAAAAKEAADAAAAVVADLDGRVASAEDKVGSAEELVTGLESSAAIVAENAAAAVAAANAAKTAVQQETTNRENSSRELSAAIERIDQKDLTQDADIRKLQKDVGPAAENAKLALNIANRRP